MLNIQEIREIIKMIDESSINEFNYETNGTSISLKKLNDVVQQAISNTNDDSKAAQQSVVATTPVEKSESLSDVQSQDKEESIDSIDFDYEIVSPMVGTLYRASSPENDNFVEVGTMVSKDSIVCIVEAMKLFNEIIAEIHGEIVEVLVEDGELIEFGQPLFRVKKK